LQRQIGCLTISLQYLNDTSYLNERFVSIIF
jgi:hypothetical protein